VSDLRLNGVPLTPGKPYRVASWASVAEGVQGRPVWEVVAEYLRAHSSLAAPVPNVPVLQGVEGNPGLG
jgi:sulfur-oxidizing protein SoxB